MKLTKRITSLLLIFVFALTSMYTGVMAAEFSDVATENVYYKAITALVDSGIINGYEDGTFKPDNTITRAEFSKLLAVSSAPSGYAFSATATTFPDIADANAAHGWAVPYIAYAVSTKAINGYDDGTFRAGNPVTYGEAVKMIVCTLGYGPVVNTTLTPWYQGYINVATQIGLSKGAMSTGDKAASRGIVAQLIYNMLECPPLVQTGTDALGNPIYSNTAAGNSSFADSKDNATSGEGVVMGVTDYSLDGTAVGRNRVQIDNTVYTLADNLDMDTVKSYIGYRVNFAYSGSGSKAEVNKITRMTGYNTEVTVEPDQIAEIGSNYIEYYATEDDEAKNKTTKITLSPRFFVVYNGMPVNPSELNAAFVTQYFDVETGSLRLFSNDGGDSNAEVVFIESYETYFANSPSNSNGVTTLYDKNSKYTSLPSLAISEEDATNVTKISSKGAKPASSALTAISNKSVVSVAVPYGAEAGKSAEGTTVVISSSYVTGDVTELSSDYEHIMIGTAVYELSPYYRKLLDNPTFVSENPNAVFSSNDNAKFYLDYLGRIAYVEKNETSDPYGLLVAYAAGSGIDSDNALKILTTGGKYLEYKMKSTIRFNDGVTDESMSSAQAIDKLKTTALIQSGDFIIQPVKYRTSGSTFTAIETLTAAAAQQSLTYSKSGPAFKSGSSTKFSMITSGTKATHVFVVPNDITKFDKYSRKAATYFDDGSSYSVIPYEMEGSAARIVVCQLAGGQTVGAKIGASTPVYLIDSITDVQNGGENVKKIRYRNIATTDGVNEAVSSADTDVIAKFATIQAGDIVKFVSEGNEIIDIQKVYSNGVLASASPIGVVQNGNPNHIALSGNNISNYFQAIVGTIHEVDGDGDRMSVIPDLYVNSALDESQLITLSRAKADIPVYEYKSVGNQGPVFTVSSVGALSKYIDFWDTEPAKATQALVIIMNEKVVGIYIIK